MGFVNHAPHCIYIHDIIWYNMVIVCHYWGRKETHFFFGNHTARRWICDYPVMVVWPSHNWVITGLKTRWKGLTKSRCVRVEYEIRFFQLQELRWVLYTPIYCVLPIRCISGHQKGTRKSTRNSWKKRGFIPNPKCSHPQGPKTFDTSVSQHGINIHTYIRLHYNKLLCTTLNITKHH